jgi:hypothetical protein
MAGVLSIQLPDELIQAVNHLAEERGTTAEAVVEGEVRELLAAAPDRRTGQEKRPVTIEIPVYILNALGETASAIGITAERVLEQKIEELLGPLAWEYGDPTDEERRIYDQELINRIKELEGDDEVIWWTDPEHETS